MKEETNPTWMEVHGGFAKDMTLRDHFAAFAVQALIARAEWDLDEPDFYSKWAYELADSMIAIKQSREAK